jgi:phosphoglycolate phosphatase
VIPNHIKHIIWDWNGTLVDDAQRCVDIMNGIRGRRSMSLISIEDYRRLFDFPVVEYYRRIGFDLEEHPFETLSNEFISEYVESRKDLPLQPGALDALTFFREKNIPQCVLSATQSDALRKTLDEYQLTSFFKTILGLDHHYADGKAHLGDTWLEKNHIDKEHVLLIGDTLHDREVATKMGIHYILISKGHHSNKRLRERSSKVLDSLNELIDLL